jgi:hypothetical protein
MRQFIQDLFGAKLGSPLRGHRPLSRATRHQRPCLEHLDGRVLLSTIIWDNRGRPGNDSDHFAQYYGAAAETARRDVDQAIADWQATIQDFRNGSNTFHLSITAGDRGGTILGTTWYGLGFLTPFAGDRPTSANIQLDDNGAGSGWFFDPTPNDDSEFPHLLNRFAATGGPAGEDFYSTAEHELGHAMGFYTQWASPFAIESRMTPIDATHRAFHFLDGTIATLTTQGGLHTSRDNLPGYPSHPDDLMNSWTSPGQRRLISDLDARILRDGYNYSVPVLPSARRTFLVVPNVTTHVLTVNADPQAARNYITVDGQGVRVNVNDVSASLPASSVAAIVVQGGSSVNIEKSAAGKPITVNLGFYGSAGVGTTSRFLDNIQGDVTIHGNGSSALSIFDQNDPYSDTYTVTDRSVRRSYSAPINYDHISLLRVYGSGTEGTTYNVESTAADALNTEVHAGAGNDTFNLSPTAKDLGTLRGRLYLDGGAGTDSMIVWDAFVDTYTVGPWHMTVAGLPSLSLGYGNIESWDLYTKPGSIVADQMGSWQNGTWVSPLRVHRTL